MSGFEDGELQRIDLASGKAKSLLRTGGAMRHLVGGDPEGRRLYADDMGINGAFVVDLASERVRRLAWTDSAPNTIDLNPDGRVLYVSNRGRNGANCDDRIHLYAVPADQRLAADGGGRAALAKR